MNVRSNMRGRGSGYTLYKKLWSTNMYARIHNQTAINLASKFAISPEAVLLRTNDDYDDDVVANGLPKSIDVLRIYYIYVQHIMFNTLCVFVYSPELKRLVKSLSYQNLLFENG